MKKCGIFSLMIMVVGGMVSAAPNPIKLRLSEIHMEGYPTTMSDKEFARLVNENTNGRFQIDVFANGVLDATEAEGIEALVPGELGFVRMPAALIFDGEIFDLILKKMHKGKTIFLLSWPDATRTWG